MTPAGSACLRLPGRRPCGRTRRRSWRVLSPAGLGRQPARVPPDSASRGHQERPWCRRRPSPQRWLAVPCLSTMVRPCVGISRFRGVFRLPHTPHIPPPYHHRSRALIRMRTARIDPETACVAQRDVIPPEEAAGCLLRPRWPPYSGPPSLPVIIVSWILRECPADRRTYTT